MEKQGRQVNKEELSHQIHNTQLVVYFLIMQVLNSRDPKCIEVHCGPLYLTLSRQIISQSLSSHGLACSPQLAEVLLNKLSVCNPLFVVEACTELACVGSSSDLHEVAERIPDDLTG